MKSEKLIPPDPKQCQCMKQVVNPWALGVAYPTHCENKPTVIIRERKKPHGSMSLCDECLKEAKKQLGATVTVKKIQTAKR